jgi:hypothetical protein
MGTSNQAPLSVASHLNQVSLSICCGAQAYLSGLIPVPVFLQEFQLLRVVHLFEMQIHLRDRSALPQ